MKIYAKGNSTFRIDDVSEDELKVLHALLGATRETLFHRTGLQVSTYKMYDTVDIALGEPDERVVELKIVLA